MATVTEINDFWFGDRSTARAKVWFQKNPAFDAEIRERFGESIALAKDGKLDAWLQGEGAAAGGLALIVLCDQFSRNVFRDTAGAFAADPKALSVLKEMRDRGLDAQLRPFERYIAYMPLMHAESREVQRDSVATFAALAAEAPDDEALAGMLKSAHDYAVRHAKIVERFGRYPHRNALLGRESTPEETEFLTQPNSSF